MKNAQRGFTLVEIAIVLVIFGASMMTLLGDFMQEIFAEIARTGR